MRRTENRFDRVCRRLAEIAKSRLTPTLKRLAWQRFQQTGELPTEPEVKTLIEHLRDAEGEFEELHRPAPVGEE